PELAVDFQKRRQHVTAGRRRRDLQLRRVLENLRHDALQETVVELDLAPLERLREDLFDEAHLRLVAGLVLREDGDWRVEILIVEEREERDLKRGICDAHAGRGEARVLD